MNRVKSWIKTVVIGHKVPLTGEQLAGDACSLCGHEFSGTEDPVSFGWIGLPFRRRAWACQYACTLDTIDGVEALWRSAIPARQKVWNWHLGVDDDPMTSDEDGRDTADPQFHAALAAQPQVPVEIVHPGGVLTTRPIPREHAEKIAAQAQRLGFTAMIDESRSAERLVLDQEVVTPDGPGLVLNLGAPEAGIVHVTLADGAVRTYPKTFVKPREGFGA